MQKIIILLFVTVFSNSYAFEGIIEQTYNSKDIEGTQNFTWYISGSKIKLEIQKEDGSSYTILPNISDRSINVLINEKGEDGKYYYFHVPLENADQLGDVVFLEEEKSNFKSYNAKDVKVLTEKGLMTLQYIPEIDFNTVKLGNYFTSNLEFGILKMVDIARGFPVSSMLIDTESKQVEYNLKTVSITKKSLSSSDFDIPSNYTLFQGVEGVEK